MLNYASKGIFLYWFVLLAVPVHLWLSISGHFPPIFMSVLLSAASLLSITAWLIFDSDRSSLSVRAHAGAVTLLVVIALAGILLIQSINYIGGDTIDNLGRSHFVFNLGSLVNYFLWFVIGIFSASIVQRGSKSPYLLWIAVTAFYLLLIDFSTLSINFSSDFSTKKSIYLVFADFYALAAIISIASMRKRTSIYMVVASSIVILYFLQSRASMIFFCASFVIVVIFSAKLVSKLTTMLVAYVAFTVLIEIGTSSSAGGRMLAFFDSDFTSDGSLSGRLILLRDGFHSILSQPVFGDYSSPARNHGSHTGYIHNILSYWQLYGVLIFFMVAYLIIILPAFITYTVMQKRDFFTLEPLPKLIVLLSTFVILQNVSARAYVWYVPWFLVGCIVTHLHDRARTFHAERSVPVANNL